MLFTKLLYTSYYYQQIKYKHACIIIIMHIIMHIIIIIVIIIIIIIIIKTYIWDPLITRWFFTLQLKSKNENAKGIYLLFT